MIKRYFLTFLVFILIDLFWLGLVAPKLYANQIGHLMADKPNLAAAVLFYLLYVGALLVFVINPALSSGSLLKALTSGAFLGLVMYATYDLTNLATLKNWPILITVIDLAWGSFVTALTCTVNTKLIQLLKW